MTSQLGHWYGPAPKNEEIGVTTIKETVTHRLIPSQTYKPKNFLLEIERIKNQATKINYGHLEAWQDKNGNVYFFDYENQLIDVNN